MLRIRCNTQAVEVSGAWLRRVPCNAPYAPFEDTTPGKGFEARVLKWGAYELSGIAVVKRREGSYIVRADLYEMIYRADIALLAVRSEPCLAAAFSACLVVQMPQNMGRLLQWTYARSAGHTCRKELQQR